MTRVSTATKAVLAEVSRLPLHTVVELESPDGQEVFVLGESHVKTRGAADRCREAVEAFSLRGVERLQRKQVFAGSLLGAFFENVRGTLELLSGGQLAGSTIEVALDLPAGQTVELERTERVPLALHVGTGYLAVYAGLAVPALLVPSLRPLRAAVKLLGLHLYALPLAYVLRDRPWAWELIVEGIRRMLAEHRATPALVIVGRAHVPGIVERLLEHGFRRVDGTTELLGVER
jgi:hypothetical protein